MKSVKFLTKFLGLHYIGIAIYGIVTFWHFFNHYPDLNWDRANYADYIVYSLLNNRWESDWAVGGLNNYNNPITSIPGYLFSIGNGLLGFLFLGCFLLCMYYYSTKIIEILFSTYKVYGNRLVKNLATNVILLGPLFLSEIGTTMGDWPIVLLTTASIYYYFQYSVKNKSWQYLALSVFLMTIATMLKISNAIFLVSFLISLFIASSKTNKLLVSFKGVVLGLFPAVFLGAIWMYRVFNLTGNPIFPYYNGIFRSDYFSFENLRDRRWEANTPLEFFSPLTGFWGQSNLEFQSFDPRTPLLFIFLALLILFRIFRAKKMQEYAILPKKINSQSPITFLVVYTLISYLSWALLLFYARYAMPLEPLVGILLLYVTFEIFQNLKYLRIILLGIYALSLFAVVPNWNLYQKDFERAVDVSTKYQGDPRWQVQNQELMRGNSVYLVVGMHMGYLVRSSNPSNSFIRVEFYGKPMPVPKYFKQKIVGPNLYMLTNLDPQESGIVAYQTEVVAKYGLGLDAEKCRSYNSINEQYWICSLQVKTLLS